MGVASERAPCTISAAGCRRWVTKPGSDAGSQSIRVICRERRADVSKRDRIARDTARFTRLAGPLHSQVTLRDEDQPSIDTSRRLDSPELHSGRRRRKSMQGLLRVHDAPPVTRRGDVWRSFLGHMASKVDYDAAVPATAGPVGTSPGRDSPAPLKASRYRAWRSVWTRRRPRPMFLRAREGFRCLWRGRSRRRRPS